MKRRVVIICPKGVRTGGPKDLHQLGHALVHDFQFDAVLCDINPKESGREFNLPHSEYTKFGMVWIQNCEIRSGDILIFPETFLRFTREYPNNLKVIWWLSYYNGVSSNNRRIIRRLEFFTKFAVTYLPAIAIISAGHRFRIRLLKSQIPKDVIHVSQSEYAFEALNRAGIQSLRLRDFLDDFWLKSRKPYISPDSHLILSNGAKNKTIIEKIMVDPLFNGYNFELLSGLTQEELEQRLSQAIMYVDFGYHPGKDHLPREAAAVGLPVVLNMRGAAGNPFDYRHNIVGRIRNPLSRRGKRQLHLFLKFYSEQELHRAPQSEILSNEKSVFLQDLGALVRKLD